ncbi:hypothetical protein ACQZV8_12970 [Magnetococcales bacterium HHB-1]
MFKQIYFILLLYMRNHFFEEVNKKRFFYGLGRSDLDGFKEEGKLFFRCIWSRAYGVKFLENQGWIRGMDWIRE